MALKDPEKHQRTGESLMVMVMMSVLKVIMIITIITIVMLHKTNDKDEDYNDTF